MPVFIRGSNNHQLCAGRDCGNGTMEDVRRDLLFWGHFLHSAASPRVCWSNTPSELDCDCVVCLVWSGNCCRWVVLRQQTQSVTGDWPRFFSGSAAVSIHSVGIPHRAQGPGGRNKLPKIAVREQPKVFWGDIGGPPEMHAWIWLFICI